MNIESIGKILKAQIEVHYEGENGRGGNTFYSLQELKAFLDKYPRIAEKLGYVKKEK